MRQIVIFLSFFIWGFCTWAQPQLPPSISQYMFNPLSCNPAYAGFYDMTMVSNLYRSQISQGNATNFSDLNLFTNTLNIHSSLPIDKMGAGLNLTYDQAGITRAINADISLSYKLQFGSNKLSLGASGTIFNLKNDYDKLKYDEESDPNYKSKYVPKNIEAITKPNFGLGLMYSGRKFFGSFSVPRILSITKDYQFVSVEDSNSTYEARYKPYVCASIGKVFSKNDKLELKPSVMIKYVDGLGLLSDLNFSVLVNKMFWLGTSLRAAVQNPQSNTKNIFKNISTLAIMGQVQATERLKAGFSYDIALSSQIISVQRGYRAPFELMVNYNVAVFNEQGIHTFLY